MSVTRFDPLGCTASAFGRSDAGEIVFLPFGKAGSAYAARDPERMRPRIRGVRIFCAAATLILVGWLALLLWQKLDGDPDGWNFIRTLGPALGLWLLAYMGWAKVATRGLEKVEG